MMDKGLRLQVDTQELVPSDKAEVMSMYGDLGVFVFSKVDIKPEDLVELPEVKTEKKKTDSQRLRDRMFVYYKWKYEKSDGFDYWYSRELDRIGQDLLDKMN